MNVLYKMVLMLALALLASMPVTAETIHLKNGRTILADNVHENGNKVEYTVGDNTFAISKTSVERIDAGGTPIVTRRDETPAPAPAPSLPFSTELGVEVVKDGKIDTEVIANLEQQGKPEKAAVANFMAARFEQENNHLDSALRYLDRARTFLPENASLMGHQASLLIQMGRLVEAGSLAEKAMRAAPNQAYGYSLVGYVYYQQSKTKEAIKLFQRSLELQPDPTVQELLARAERELSAESKFSEEASSHFTLKFEGGQAPAALRHQILETLEQHYNDLVRELEFAPRETVVVLLYTNQQYFDVTQAPSWSGALYDGKLRMPINGVANVTSDLSRTLRHELTHSFINQITKGRCPTWLNEGVAQLIEPRSASSQGRRLASLYGTGHNIPFSQLEGNWISFGTAEAVVAYAQALIAAEYIRQTYGMSSLALALKRIGEGQSTEMALRSTIHSGYSQLEQELAAYLKRTYGE